MAPVAAKADGPGLRTVPRQDAAIATHRLSAGGAGTDGLGAAVLAQRDGIAAAGAEQTCHGLAA